MQLGWKSGMRMPTLSVDYAFDRPMPPARECPVRKGQKLTLGVCEWHKAI